MFSGIQFHSIARLFQNVGSRMAAPMAIVVLSGTLLPSPVLAQSSEVEKALRISPKQRDVEFDLPKTKKELAGCKIESTSKTMGVAGYIIRDSAGRTLKLLLDNNGDKNLDQWSYFKDGIEVYRDIDSNYDGKTDQYRWVGSAGTRWGIDRDQNGTIDYWKRISAEEVSREIFEAVRTRDVKRFERVLLSSQEIKSLRLGDKMTKQVGTKVATAQKGFATAIGKIRGISSASRWQHFGSGDNRPNIVPKGTEGIQADLETYNHSSAMFTTNGEYGQISIGSLVRVGDVWKCVELPEVLSGNQMVSNGGVFLKMPEFTSGTPDQVVVPEAVARIGKLYDEVVALEKKRDAASSPMAVANYELGIAKKSEELAAATKGVDRRNWIEQMADGVSDAYLNERFPKGMDFLNDFIKRRARDKWEVDYAAWKILQTRFSERVAAATSRREQAKATELLMGDLEKFANAYPKSPESPGALIRLALDAEYQNDFELATKRYRQIARTYDGKPEATRAKGAIVRLSSNGKTVPFKGKTFRGQGFDLSNPALRGKMVVIHYWQSDYDFSTRGFDDLASLQAKWSKELVVVGANLDADPAKAQKVLAGNRSVRWTQLYAAGGLEKSPLATQLGIATMPTILLIDQKGQLVEANLTVGELDREVQNVHDRYNKSRRSSSQARNTSGSRNK